MYEIGYNTVNDVNFSLETAILAKNQILQQASTAMLAQANTSQQGLLQLIQGKLFLAKFLKKIGISTTFFSLKVKNNFLDNFNKLVIT